MAQVNKRADILAVLDHARSALIRAADHRMEGRTYLARGAVNSAQSLIWLARQAMATAPASTRRRWKHAETINARKRMNRLASTFASNYQQGKFVVRFDA